MNQFIFYNHNIFHIKIKRYIFYNTVWSVVNLKLLLLNRSIIIKNELIAFSPRNHISTYVDSLPPFDRFRRIHLLNKQSINILPSSSVVQKEMSSLYSSIYSIEDIPSEQHIKSWKHYYKGRYGVGSGLSNLFDLFTGMLPFTFLNIDFFNRFFYKYEFKRFFYIYKSSFDNLKVLDDFYSFHQHKTKFTYKGWCFFNNYPVNGQRRRANYKTSRKYNRSKILKIYK